MAKRTGPETATTELEAAVLGVVWRDGPCTAYAIRQNFLESRSPRWSGSAGALYPLVKRLEARGLLQSKPSARGKRAQLDLRITPRGEAALKRWLRSPAAESDATLLHDPLRTRMLFLRVLPSDEVQAVIADALGALQDGLRQAEEDARQHPATDDPFEYFAARNALLLSRARVKWLKEVQARFSDTMSTEALRTALIEGEESGTAGPLDVDEIKKQARREAGSGAS